MRVDLNGQPAIVTGGAQGIGRAIVQALADNGARLAIVDIDAGATEQAAEEVRAGGGDCMAVVGDVTDAAAMKVVAAEIAGWLGGIRILVNNAGANTSHDRVPLHQYSREDWNRLIELDLTSVFYVSRAAIPFMLQGDGGRIVNISSIAGL